MSHDLSVPGELGLGLTGNPAELSELGIRTLRLQYADLHGVCRGKDIPSAAFAHALGEGITFVEAIMTVDLRHNVIAGSELGFPDLLARPDVSTVVRLPWHPEVACCIVDLQDSATHGLHPLDCRGALK